MGWSIPEVPIFPAVVRPHYGYWAIALLSMLVIALTCTLFSLGNSNYHDQRFWFYSLLLPFCGWLILFALRVVYYQLSILAHHRWEKATKQTIFEWQEWSRQQLPVLAQAILTPDTAGVQALLAQGEDRPLFPQKVRPLVATQALLDDQSKFDSQAELTDHFLMDIHHQLEQDYPQYRRYLATIYISARLSENAGFVERIYQVWHLYPEKIDNYADWLGRIFNQPPAQPILILNQSALAAWK